MKFAWKTAALASWLRFGLAVIGWPGALGLALLIVGATLQFLMLPRQELATDAARRDAERQRQAWLQAATGHRAPDLADSLAQFRERLTTEGKADEALDVIQRDARKNGLQLAGIDYKWQRQPAARLAEVQITMPVKGGYASLRGFLDDVLTDVPGLALEQCDLQRDSIAAASAEARLRFTLYLRADA